MKNERNIARYLFIGILILHVLGCYIMGTMILADTQFALETGFGITFNSELEILGMVIGMELLFLGTMALIGILWTSKSRLSGVVIGSAVGGYMFAFGIVAFLKFGTTDALVVDSIRGFVTLVLGYFAYREIKAKS